MILKKVGLVALMGALALVGTPGNAVAATTGPQEFTVVKIGTNTGTVVARGVITAAGTEENNRLQVPRGAPFQVEFTFPEGKLFQTITPVGAPTVRLQPDNVCVPDHDRRQPDGSCLPATSLPIFEMSLARAHGTLTN